MHPSVMEFVRSVTWSYDRNGKRVLEVGSLNVNGTVRPLFEGVGEYVGVDMQSGPCVDIVMNAHGLWECWGPEFDLIVCCEMLEHDDRPWESLSAMADVAVDGGHLILTCRGYHKEAAFPYHGYPHDYWRYTPVGLRNLLEFTGWTPLTVRHDDDWASPGVFATAVKEA